MNRLGTMLGVGTSVLTLMAAAAPAMASGGAGAGGGGTTTRVAGGSGGGGATVSGGGGGGTVSGGGGTASGGGGQTRGATDPVVPAPAPAPVPVFAGTPCATFSSASVPVGYYLTFAALWHDYSIRSCNPAGLESVSVRVTDVNRATGNADFTVTTPVTLDPSGNYTDVIDNDFAPFSVDYDVKMEILNDAGNVLDSSLLSATTPPAR